MVLWLVSVLGVCLSAVFVIARLAQRLSKTGLGMNDYMILASPVASGLLSMIECQGQPFTFVLIVVLVQH
jgi:hypothetical protein